MIKQCKIIVSILIISSFILGCSTDETTPTTGRTLSPSSQYVLLPETVGSDFIGSYIEASNAIYFFDDKIIYNIDGLEYSIRYSAPSSYILAQGNDFIKVTQIDSENYELEFSDGTRYEYSSISQEQVDETVTLNGYEGIWYEDLGTSSVEVYYVYTDKIKLFLANYETGSCTLQSEILGVENVNAAISENIFSDVIEQAIGSEYSQAEEGCGLYSSSQVSLRAEESTQVLESVVDSALSTMGNVFETYAPLAIVKSVVDGVKSRIDNLNIKFENIVTKVSTFHNDMKTKFNGYSTTLKSEISSDHVYDVGIVSETQVSRIKADTLGTTSQVSTYVQSGSSSEVDTFESTGSEETTQDSSDANVYCMKEFRDAGILAAQEGLCTTSNDACQLLGGTYDFTPTTSTKCRETCINNASEAIKLASADFDGSNALYFTTQCLAAGELFSSETKVPLTESEACLAGFAVACENGVRMKGTWQEAMDFCASNMMKLPNKEELVGIWEAGEWGDITGVYWSSTEQEEYENNVWYVYFGLDWVRTAAKDNTNYYGRCIPNQ